MFFIKSAVLILVLESVTFANVLNKSSEESIELIKIEPLSSEEAILVPKAHWKPICEQVLINELEAKPVIPESEVVLLPQDIPGIVISPGRDQSETCIAPNGGGITTFLREAYELLPHDRLNAIKNKAANEPEVQKFEKFLNSEHFRTLQKALFKTNAFVVFRDYACHKLYFDIDELLQFGANILDFQQPRNMEIKTRSNTGMQGLLEDIKNALPLNELFVLLKRKLETDEYLKKAKDLMKSREFISIAEAVEDQPEYVALMRALRENGLQFEVLVEYARKIAEPDCKSSVVIN